jgi:hypothetical protein
MCLIARDFFDKFADGDGALIAGAIQAAQTRGEIDATLDPEIATNTLFGALEGIGLRRAFCREIDAEAAINQFRALAERYLEPRT